MTPALKAVLALVALVCLHLAASAQDAAIESTKHARQHRTSHARTERKRPFIIPQQFAPPQEAFASRPEKLPDGSPALSACQLRLAKVATFRPLPVLVGPGECGATDAVQLESIILTNGVKVGFATAPTLRCSMAEAVSGWIREDVAPAAVKMGTALRGIDNYDSYECRGRNRVRGATLSEHGRANALDIRSFKLANGHVLGLTDIHAAKAFRETIRASVCARFSTVLGPGSDGSHEEHIHLDLAERRGGYKLCEWDVREPVRQAKAAPGETEAAEPLPEGTVPLPRPRPAVAGRHE